MSNVAPLRRLHAVPAADTRAHEAARAHAPGEAADIPQKDDADTLRRVQLGDTKTWTRLYRQCYAGLYRQLRYLTGDRALAEELAQETFAQAMISRERYDGRKGFRAWIHGIGLNVVRKHWRKQRNASTAYERFEALLQIKSPQRHSAMDPDLGYLRRERSRALYAALEELSPRLREAFVLRELQGLSTAEASRQLNITPGNLAVRVTRARARIRELLTTQGWISRASGRGRA
jgi:RNA polymerase sigma-70 factor (ECF subfamily)